MPMKKTIMMTCFLVIGMNTSFYLQSPGQGPKWQVLEMNRLISQLISEQKYWMTFLDNDAMMCGLYLLPKGTVDRQEPHKQDEVYYIVKGKANIEVEGKKYPVKEKSIVYVQAGAAHKFTDISEDLLSLVVFTKITPVTNDEKVFVYDYSEIQATQTDTNIWNPFLDIATMKFGLYSLPETLGGDDFLTHEVSEINYVVQGEARFTMGDDEVEVKPGSIMFVREGIPHKFHSLSGDFEVLILFEKKG